MGSSDGEFSFTGKATFRQQQQEPAKVNQHYVVPVANSQRGRQLRWLSYRHLLSETSGAFITAAPDITHEVLKGEARGKEMVHRVLHMTLRNTLAIFV